ncbi:restriction endonuclease [Micrococcus luteus]|nr:restriction endonuclease [Micrococcus luteus]
MKIDIAQIAASLEAVIRPDDPPERLVKILYWVISVDMSDQPNLQDDSSIWELAESVSVDVADEVDTRQANAETDGVFYGIEIFGSNREYVRGSCFPDANLAEPLREGRSRRLKYAKIREFLDGINWREFEYLSRYVVQKMGADRARFSSRSDDGGIDFYGRLELEGRLDDQLPLGGVDRRLHVWLVGQSKHYPSSEVGPAEVRELVGAVELARTGGAPQKWDGLSLRPFDPVAYLFFTTGRFSRGARKLLAHSGVVAMNGDQLATFLADVAAGINPVSGEFDRDVMMEEVRSSFKSAEVSP